MKKIFLFLSLAPLALFAQISSLQTLFSVPGGVQTRAAVENAFGDIYVAASFLSGVDDGDLAIIKLVNGVPDWTKHLPLPGVQGALDVAAHSNGDLTVLCSYGPNVFNIVDFMLVRIDAAGNVLWTKVLGSADIDYMNRVDVLSGDRIRLSGAMPLGGILRPATLIFDGNGSLISEKYINVTNYASPNFSAYAMSNGNIIYSGSNRLGLVCDSTGVWQSNVPVQLGGESGAACSGNSGNYIVAYTDNIGAPSGGSNIVVGSQTPGVFQLNWLNKFSTSFDEFAEAIFYHEGIITLITNQTTSNNGLQALGITLIDTTGAILSSKSLMPAGYDYLTVYSCRQNPDGSILVSSMVQNSSFEPNGWVVKISPEGDAGCNPPAFNFSTQSTSGFPADACFNLIGTSLSIDSLITANTQDTAFTIATPCLVVGISNDDKVQEDRLSPNPSAGLFTIHAYHTGDLLQVFDLAGRKITHQGSASGVLDLSDQPNGIYLLQHLKSDGTQKVHRLVLYR